MEGRVLAGLDEFMLRVGHLSLLCQGVMGRRRFPGREFSARPPRKLSLEVSVAPNENHDVAVLPRR